MIYALIFFLSIATSHAAPTKLSFSDILKETLKRNPAIQSQEKLLDSVRYENLENKYTLLPTLNAEVSQGYTSPSNSTNAYERTIGATSEVNLFKFGGDSARMRLARNRENNQEAKLEQTIFNAEDAIAETYFDYVERLKIENVSVRSVDNRKALIRIAKQRYQKGLLASQEVDKIQIDLDNELARLKEATLSRIESKEALKNLLGHDNVETQWPWSSIFTNRNNFAAVQTGEVALRSRPDWKTAQTQVEVTQSLLDRDYAAIFPSLDASLSFNHINDLRTSASSYYQWVGAVTLSIPLFNRLSLHGTYRSQVANRDSAELDFEQTKRDAREDWTVRKESFLVALDTARARDKTFAAAKRLFQTSLLRLKKGRASANDLAVDENRLNQSERFSAQGWRRVHVEYTKLCHSIGLRIHQCLMNDGILQ